MGFSTRHRFVDVDPPRGQPRRSQCAPPCSARSRAVCIQHDQSGRSLPSCPGHKAQNRAGVPVMYFSTTPPNAVGLGPAIARPYINGLCIMLSALQALLRALARRCPRNLAVSKKRPKAFSPPISLQTPVQPARQQLCGVETDIKHSDGPFNQGTC